MKQFRFRPKRYEFDMTIPNGWRRALLADLVASALRLVDVLGGSPDPKASAMRQTTLVGPEGGFLHILATPLLDGEAEPTIAATEDFFEGLAYRQSLQVMATGTIEVAHTSHFWATYFRLPTASGVANFYKKYCLYMNRAEYLATAVLYSASRGRELPTDQILKERERVYDSMVSSIVPLVS